jgi:prophage regulatory protein
MKKIIKISALCTVTAKSRSSCYDAMNPSSKRYDPTFPRQLKIGSRAVGWLESEVVEWVDSQSAKRNITGRQSHV